MTAHTAQILRTITFWLLVSGLAGWVVVRSVQKAEEPLLMIVKWIITAIMLWLLFGVIAPMVLTAPVFALPMTGGCSLVLVIVWRHSIASLIAQPFADLYTGGSTPPEPR